MNREHLYKAKRVNWRELPKEEWWVEGDLIHEPYGTVIQYYEDEIKDKGSCAKASRKKRIKVVVDPETVCEYTGLPDKNKRKIFEWDIVRTKYYGKDSENGCNFNDYDMYVIDYGEATFRLDNKERRYFLTKLKDIEVIGNKFDNPDLLKGVILWQNENLQKIARSG